MSEETPVPSISLKDVELSLIHFVITAAENRNPQTGNFLPAEFSPFELSLAISISDKIMEHFADDVFHDAKIAFGTKEKSFLLTRLNRPIDLDRGKLKGPLEEKLK